MNVKIIIAGLMAIALAGCSNGDPKAYLGYWKKSDRKYIVLEITDKGNNHYLLKELDLHLGPGFPPRNTMASMKDGELLIEGVEPVPILKDGSLFYSGREFVRQTDVEVAEMKQNANWQHYNKP